MLRKMTLLIAVLLQGIASAVQATTLRLATYNVWNPLFEERYAGQETWDQRLPFIIENILASDCDVLCLEEIGDRGYLDISQHPQMRERYRSIYISHTATPGQQEGRDGLAFFYRPAKCTLVRLMKSSEGSRPTHRRDFIADLTVDGLHFRVACTHLDSGKDLTIGNVQLSGLVQDVLHRNLPADTDFVALCGDFNEGEDEAERPREAIMRLAGFFSDGLTATTRPEALDVRHKGHVDWLYFKALSERRLELIPVTPLGDERASDHKLTLTDVISDL